nr:helix-turn-helix domain-containing protein [uncultured Dongia sp.]
MPLRGGKAHSTLTLSTDDVPPAQARSYWEECVARTYLAMSVTPLGDGPFRATLQANTVHDITVAHVATTGQSGRRAVGTEAGGNERCLLLINLSGEIHLRHNAREITLHRHDMTVIDSRRPSEYAIPAGATALAVNMPRQALTERFPQAGLFAAAKLPANLPMQQMTIGFFGNLLENSATASEGATAMRLAGHAMDMLGIALNDALTARIPASPYRTALLRRIKDFVEEHLHEPMLSVQAVASKFRITPRYVAMLFRDEATTFSDFVRQRRLERCRRQLEGMSEDRRQIGAIALAAGFASQAHFSRLFRATYHATPRQYRSAFQRRSVSADTHNGAPADNLTKTREIDVP